MASVSLRNVQRSYGDVHVVRGVNVEIRDGEFVVLVGASGCGKSTLLRMLAGLDTPTGGEIAIDGRVVNELRPRERDIAMVFQSYALYPHMTVRDNLGFALKVRGDSADVIAKGVAEAARMLELGSLLDRYPRQLSGGQRQRVAMGRALVRRPRVFLFDEPLSNLDAALRAQMRIELKRLHQQLGITTVYVTHDQIEAMTLADRIALMHKGQIQQFGTPRELYEWPANRYTAGFLGSPAMNFVEGDLRGSQFSAPGVSLAVAADRLVNGAGAGRVIAGVRPHDLAIEASDAPGAVDGTIYALEPMGWETIAHVDVAGARWTARVESVSAVALKVGQPITLRVAAAHVRLFDVVSDNALLKAPELT